MLTIPSPADPSATGKNIGSDVIQLNMLCDAIGFVYAAPGKHKINVDQDIVEMSNDIACTLFNNIYLTIPRFMSVFISNYSSNDPAQATATAERR